MAISVDYTLTPWLITIPKADLTLDTGTKYNLDVDVFWQLLRDYADSPEGVVSPIIYTRIAATTSTPSITEVNDDYYELQFEDGLYSVNIINGNTNIRDVEVKNQVSVNTNNTTGFIDPTFLEFSTFDGFVHVNTISGSAGTLYPIGTPGYPVNNWIDAHSIAESIGIKKFHIMQSSTLTGAALDLSDGHIFVGFSPVTVSVTIDTSIKIANCEFLDMQISGILDGNSVFRSCIVGNVNYINGFISHSTLNGTISLDGNANATIHDCWQLIGGTIPIIDLGGIGQQVSISDYKGAIKLTNNAWAGHNYIHCEGTVELDSTITAGHFHIFGNCSIINNSTGTTIEDKTTPNLTWNYPMASVTDTNSVGYEILEHLHDLHYEGVVWVDSVNGTAGTVHPIGTKLVPALTIADAVIIANGLGIVDISIIEDVTILATDNISGLLIYGAHASKSQIILNAGCNTTFTQFTNCQLTGTAGGEIVVRDSVIDDLAGFIGILHQCAINGSIVLSGDGTKSTHILSCYSGVPGASAPELDFNNLNIPLGIRDYNGGIKLVNKTGAADVSIDLNSGQVILNGTVTAGNIVVRGVGKITNTSTAEVDDTHLVQQSKLLKFAQYIGLS